MARQFNITGNNIKLATAVASGTAAMFVQFRLLDLSAVSHTLLGIYQATTFDGLRIDILSSRKAQAISRAAGTPAGATSTNTVDDVSWHCVLAQFGGTTLRTIRLDVGDIVSDTTSNIPGTLTKTVFGARDASGVISQELGHEIARAAIWNVSDITDEEYYAMIGGAPCAEIRQSSLALKADVDLGGDVFDYFNQPWVITGTSVVDDPPLVFDPWEDANLVGFSAFAARNSVMINQAVNRASTY